MPPSQCQCCGRFSIFWAAQHLNLNSMLGNFPNERFWVGDQRAAMRLGSMRSDMPVPVLIQMLATWRQGNLFGKGDGSLAVRAIAQGQQVVVPASGPRDTVVWGGHRSWLSYSPRIGELPAIIGKRPFRLRPPANLLLLYVLLCLVILCLGFPHSAVSLLTVGIFSYSFFSIFSGLTVASTHIFLNVQKSLFKIQWEKCMPRMQH